MISLSDILVVVVAYCPEDDILAHCPIEQVQYFIVDNSPTPSQAIAGKCHHKKNFHYSPLHDNKGIAYAFNKGCEYAIAHGFSWVVTMDQDSEMNLTILQRMIDFANRFQLINELAIISPRHIFPNGEKNKVPDEAAEYTEGLYPMSSGNLLNLEIWKKLSGFDNDLFIDMVDTDYYCKAMINGYKVLMLNKVEMTHKLGNMTVKKIKTPQRTRKIYVLNHNAIRKYYQVRNALTVMKRYRDALPEDVKKIRIFLIATLVGTIFFENQRIKKIQYILLGLRDYLLGRTGKLKERKK